MANMVAAVGLMSSVLGIVGFMQSNVPEKKTSEGATVVIKAGLPPLDKEGDSLSGEINKIYAFDERNGYAGEADGCKIDSGGICTVIVDQSTPGRRAGYISVSNNKDATCIAWISVTQFDGSFGGAWTGDVGRACGQRWYPSEEPAGHEDKNDSSSKEWKPACTWLDGDHDKDVPMGSLKFNTGTYGSDVEKSVKNDACKGTIFGKDNAAIADKPGRKRSVPERPAWMVNQLITSNHTQDTAADVCGSETSWGPDFIGVDGEHCDMATKTLTPLCKTKDVVGCVELDEKAGTLKKRMNVARRSADVVHKTYGEVKQWGRSK